MNLIIVHSVSKYQRSMKIASGLKGDTVRIEHNKKAIKNPVIQMIVYGFQTVAKKRVHIKEVSIDYEKYSDIYLVSPVWAGRVNAYMRQFLMNHPFENKKVHLIGSCDGGYQKYFESFKDLIDVSNHIVEKAIYVKGMKQS